MRAYRLYVYDSEDHLIGPALPVAAEDDRQAIEHAAKLVNGSRAELRDHLRLVKEFVDSEQRSSQCRVASQEGGDLAMKLITEYLEHAARFERMAAEEKDPKLKAELETQAVAYHKLAAKRAEQTGVPLPERAKHSNR